MSDGERLLLTFSSGKKGETTEVEVDGMECSCKEEYNFVGGLCQPSLDRKAEGSPSRP